MNTQPSTPTALDEARIAFEEARRAVDRTAARLAARDAAVTRTASAWLDHEGLVAELRPLLDDARAADNAHTAAVQEFIAATEAYQAASAAVRIAGGAR